jgi:hypothetical protein
VGMGLVRLNFRLPGAVSHVMTGQIGNARARVLVLVSTGALAALLFVACGGSGDTAGPTTTSAAATTSSTAPLRDVTPTAADFVNINRMTRVGDHFIASLNGHLEEALAVARNPRDAVYPVGTVIQLIPTEAMVKRHEGYSPSTGDWQFFSLNVSPTGTEIESSGPKVKNFLGGDCASCHVAAKSHFDFVCEKGHGCAPIGVTDELIATIQKGDPRPER